MEKNSKLILFLTVFLLGFSIYLFSVLPSVLSWGPGPNYANVSVRTTVNITESMPEILNITCNSGAAVTLSAGTVQNVSCLIQIRDYNGGNTLNGSNGSGVNTSVFYYILNQSGQSDDNNVHYTNNSCSASGTPNGFYVNWTCGFYLWYYANNGTWIVNVTVHDRHSTSSYNVSGVGNASISPLYALNVTDLIDFGNMFVGETSLTPIGANITNFGNMNINITLYGFGSDNFTLYSNYAMICDVRNISMASERYSLNSSEPFATMTAITNSAVLLPALTLAQQQDDANQVINSTYWRLYVNPTENPFGICNGTVVFSAISSV